MFESLKNFVKTNIEDLDGKELEISKEFKEHHNKDSKYIIKNWIFESHQYRKWRITKLDGGDKLQVFNTVAYPNFKSEFPILGADILWFGTSQKLLAIFDYQPLIQEKEYLQKYNNAAIYTGLAVTLVRDQINHLHSGSFAEARKDWHPEGQVLHNFDQYITHKDQAVHWSYDRPFHKSASQYIDILEKHRRNGQINRQRHLTA